MSLYAGLLCFGTTVLIVLKFPAAAVGYQVMCIHDLIMYLHDTSIVQRVGMHPWSDWLRIYGCFI